MAPGAPSLASLEGLVTSPDIRDRAFAASILRLRRSAENQVRVAELYELLGATARGQHTELRSRIRAGALDRQAFVAQLAAAPLDIRDQLVEEVLGVAYPPLSEWQLPRDAVPYSPSGVSEVLFAIENGELGPSKAFVDLGSGLGKVVLLVALLSGAQAQGVELDPHLVASSRAAADSLGICNARFTEGDIRADALPAADVYYMFIPVLRSTDIARRLAAVANQRSILLFAPGLDLKALPWLEACNRSSYWLEMYESRRSRTS